MSRIVLRIISLGSILSALIFLIGCKSHKVLIENDSVVSDSVSISTYDRSLLMIDSLFHSSSFTFDSIEIQVIHPSFIDSIPISFKMNAVNGNFQNRYESKKEYNENIKSLDSLLNKVVSNQVTEKKSDSSQVYSPPNGNALLLLLIIAATIIVISSYKKL